MISERELENLGELARIEIPKKEEAKLLKDLEKIIAHFEELKTLDTKNVPPMTGGTFEENVYRADDDRETSVTGDNARDAFPEKQSGYLKVPPVFE